MRKKSERNNKEERGDKHRKKEKEIAKRRGEKRKKEIARRREEKREKKRKIKTRDIKENQTRPPPQSRCHSRNVALSCLSLEKLIEPLFAHWRRTVHTSVNM